MKKFLKEWVVLTFAFVFAIIAIIYSIKWSFIASNNPDISYLDMRRYPYTHFDEYWPMFAAVFMCALYSFVGHKIQETIKKHIIQNEKKQKNHR